VPHGIDEMAVLDPDTMRLRAMNGLWLVDASVMGM
jgi:choline dehydrogenase-like flavoprotein